MLWDATMQQSQDILGDKGSGALIRHENRNMILNNGSQYTAREEAQAHRLIPTRYQGQVLEIHVDRDLQEVVLMGNGELTLTMSDLHGAMMDLMALSKEMTDNGGLVTIK